MTEANKTFNSVLEASVLHMGNVGSMLMDEVAHVNERIDGRREEIEALENWKEDMQGVIHGQEDSIFQQGANIDLLKGELTTLKDLVQALVTKTGELEDDKVRLTRRVSELTGEVRDLQRKCNEPEVRVEEEELEVPERAKSPPARLVVQYCQGHSTPTTTSALSRLRRVVRGHYKSGRNPKEKPNLNRTLFGLTSKG
ncbi:hypothetical protein BJ322DRAFT_1025368 [Thelephora terrestris]|uniref:Uncharacterized protein n=1 Tax=Thelephora terrestris TaxID=56493 RepID=A0A9P6H392_9AGAM|nr:hypothetical protein BJ322DRAFT_1025368 [Thelephora terrestris]